MHKREAEIAIKTPETYHVSDGALSDLVHRTNRVLYSTGTDRRYCGPADEFPEPFPPQSSLQRIVENFRSGGQFDRLVNQIAIIRRETGFRQAIAGNW